MGSIGSTGGSGAIYQSTLLIIKEELRPFYVWVSVHHKLIYIKNQLDATWQYIY